MKSFRTVFALMVLCSAFGTLSAVPARAPEQLVLTAIDPSQVLKKDMKVLRTPAGFGAQISPDGKHLVFASMHSESNAIWVSDTDGSNAVRVASIEGHEVGTPRWAPDGKWIAFDVDGLQHGRIFVVSAVGGELREIAKTDAQNVVPNWSRDGKWIYFASDRTGRWQVWKVPFASGEPVPVSRRSGFAASESPDGEYVYFSQHRFPSPRILRVPVSGGDEEVVSYDLKPDTWADWWVTNDGIYFASGGTNHPTLARFDPNTKSVETVAQLGETSFFLSVSDDGRLAICDVWVPR